MRMLANIGSSWTAICRGAVIHGLTVEKVPSHFSVEVASRISRASYGVMCMEKWDEQKHQGHPEDRIFDNQHRMWKANNQMKWLIREVRKPLAACTVTLPHGHVTDHE